MEFLIEDDKKLITIFKKVNFAKVFDYLCSIDLSWGDYDIVGYCPPKSHLKAT